MISQTRRPPFWNAWGWRLIGVALLVLIIWHVGVRDIAGVVLQVRPLAIVVASALVAALLLLRSLRWWVLCSSLDIRLKPQEAIRFYLLGAFVGAATPGRVGDIIKAYYVRNRLAKGGLAAAIASVVYDRLLDLGQTGALALGALSTLPWVGRQWGPTLVAVGLGGFFLTTVWSPTRKGLLAMPLGWALRRLPGSDGVVPPAPPAGKLVMAHLLTLGALVCFAAATVTLARGLGIVQPTWWSLSVLAAMGALVGLLPITIFGIGTRDALFVAAAPGLGVAPESLLGLSLLLLAMYGLGGIVGWGAWVLSPPADRQPPV
ncbi:MAG: lysylphosphatidylglycerol synthase transmembrane domain-containing protein [Acidobacteriota bacterium]